MKNYQVRQKDTGYVFEEFETLKEATDYMLWLEEDDDINDTYEEDFYEVYDTVEGTERYYEYQEGDKRELFVMPYDMQFFNSEGKLEKCHATGYEVYIDEIWWNEYVDSNGNIHLGV